MTARTRRARSLGAMAAVTALAMFVTLQPRARAQETDHAKQLGMKLMCMCGCGQVLVQCNHINCPSSAPMLKELDAHIARGENDDLVVQDFVQEYGEAVLSEPPNRGFNRAAWLIPGLAFAFGLGLVTFLILQWRRRAPAPAPRPRQVSAEALQRARELADKETEE